jgi:hypothetical protein
LATFDKTGIVTFGLLLPPNPVPEDDFFLEEVLGVARVFTWQMRETKTAKTSRSLGLTKPELVVNFNLNMDVFFGQLMIGKNHYH